MKEYEGYMNDMDEGDLDESLLSAMEEFEEIYGEHNEASVEGNQEDFVFIDTNLEPIVQKNISKTSGDSFIGRKKQIWITAVCVVLVLGIGVTCFVKRKDIKDLFTSKEETTEAMAEITTSEEIATETTKAADACWFVDKTLCVPEMTPDTISLSSADLSVFTTAMQQELDEVPQEERIDPWAMVSLQLDSVEGSSLPVHIWC